MELSGIPEAKLPPPLRRGDRVGVAALSGAIDPKRLARGLRALRGLGYQPVEASNLHSRDGIFAGSDQERLDAFHDLAAEPDLRAIVFARGGHGVLRILPGIDWELLRRYPRAYVGYSDLTPFLLQVIDRLGLVSFHGPMVAADLARGLLPQEEAAFRACLEGQFPLTYPLAGTRGEGSAEGPLLGGCLSMLEATLGTPYAPVLDGAILVLEDVGEPYYRLDRMLTHLRLSDTLTKIEGTIFGQLIPAPGRQRRRAAQGRVRGFRKAGKSGDQAVVPASLLAAAPAPVGWGLDAGHGKPNLTLPLGVKARFRVEAGESMLVIGEESSSLMASSTSASVSRS